ncbi:MAG: carbon-nitrogen hydrolase family protein [Bacteroidota bacterium]
MMNGYESLKIAIVQHSPSFLNLDESIAKAEQYIEEAAKNEAGLIVFGETWFCGYPAWIDYVPEIALWGYEPTQELYVKMLKNGLCVEEAPFRHLCSLAKKHNAMLIAGANEVVKQGYGNGTIFNSLFFINQEGVLVNHHRKLMPTFTEKLLYGTGDGHGLKTMSSKYGNIGGLICWEHWMPLTRQSLHLENETIHVAVWPAVKEVHQLASRNYAFEGRCYVIAAGQILKVSDLPDILTLPKELKKNPDKYVLNGGSCVIAPNADFILEPQFDIEDIIYVTIDDWEAVLREKITLDVSGHYSRPDVFQMKVNKQRL